MSARGLRSRLGDALRRMHLLGAADRVLGGLASVVEAPANLSFRRQNPGYALPPAALAFETLGHASAAEYQATGERHARLFAAAIGAHCPRKDPAVLDWGCGSGRILRHLREAGLTGRLAGVDVDAGAIAWCRERLPGLEFAVCGPVPPLPHPDRSFDAVYHYSVLTHLTGENVEAWLDDIARVLRDDGVMVGTTHGERYADMLLPGELAAFRSGAPVTRAGALEGHKRFLAFHPPGFMRAILGRRFHDVRQVPVAEADIPQDLWIAKSPRR